VSVIWKCFTHQIRLYDALWAANTLH